MQHAWATAVEAVGIFTRQALKANSGDQDWLRFFALMSSQIAQIEGCVLVPGTPDSEHDRLTEVKKLARSLRAVQMLDAFRVTINFIGQQATSGSKYYLVEFDDNTWSGLVRAFAVILSQRANIAYTEAEQILEPLRI